MNPEPQLKTVIIRETLLQALSDGSQAGMYEAALQSRMRTEGWSSQDCDESLNYLEKSRLIRREPALLDSSIFKYEITPEGQQYIQRQIPCAIVAKKSHLPKTLSKSKDHKSLLLKTIGKGIKMTWGILVWFFTDII